MKRKRKREIKNGKVYFNMTNPTLQRESIINSDISGSGSRGMASSNFTEI